MTPVRVLLVDDEESIRETYRRLLSRAGYEVLVAENGTVAIDLLRNREIDAMITDILMPGMDGLELIRQAREIDDHLKVVIMTAHASLDSAIEAIRLGAFGYLRKPFSKRELIDSLERALTVRRAEESNVFVEGEEQCDFSGIIGQSNAIRKVFRMVTKVAPSDTTILLTGESGTGKELFARAIHANSTRSNGRFVSINCGALPESLLESELFGHVKGSFTGAIKDKEGLLVYANGGCFFMDEIGEMPPATQVRLLRVLEEREVVPVGGTKPEKVDVRVIAATNIDLESRVREGRFRADLFYRVNVIPIEIPPLRERKEDIPILMAHFVQKHTRTSGLPAREFSKEAMNVLLEYDWPGNVRELDNLVQRCLMLAEDDVIVPDDLPTNFGRRKREQQPSEEDQLTLEELEKRHILRVLERTGWHKKRTARILGIDPSTLYRKLERFGIGNRA
jgi:DNA-binding NtrC family response regulator